MRGSSRERVEQIGIGLDRIDRGEAQARELGHLLENLLHQGAEPRRAGQARPIAGEIDAGEHHLAIAARDQAAHLIDRLAHGHGARIAAAERNDAEGAAVVAAVLHLHEGAGAALVAVDRCAAISRHRHDVVDRRLLVPAPGPARMAREQRPRVAPGCGASFSALPSTRSTSGMSAKARGLDLRGAAGDHDAGLRPLALEPADGLLGLPGRLGGHRAGIDHDGVGEAGRLRMRPDDLGLVGVETAPEGHEIDAHERTRIRPRRRKRTGPDRRCRHIRTRPGRSSAHDRRARAIRSGGRRPAAIPSPCVRCA